MSIPTNTRSICFEVLNIGLRSMLGVLFMNIQQRSIPEEFRIPLEDNTLNDAELQELKETIETYLNAIQDLGYEEINNYYREMLGKYGSIF